MRSTSASRGSSAVLSLPDAIEVFAKAFSKCKSLPTPYEAVPLGPCWLLRDVPGTRKSRGPRKNELLAPCVPPDEVHRLMRDVPGRTFVCALDPDPEGDPAVYRRYRDLGYRLIVREAFFVKELGDEAFQDPRVARARTTADLQAMRAAAGTRKMTDEHFATEQMRLYLARNGDEVVGWVRSVPTAADRSWVADLWVHESHRRQGLGGALMRTMLAEDASLGIRWSVLAASKVGSLLYPQLGYSQVGTLQVFYVGR